MRRKVSASSAEEPTAKKTLYSGMVLKGGLVVDQPNTNSCSHLSPGASDPGDGHRFSLSDSFSQMFRSNRLPSTGKKANQKESSAEASGLPVKGKKARKKSTAVSPASPSTPEASLTLNTIPVDILQYWEKSFNSLLINPDGVRLFEEYLKTELSEENIQFWKACERFKMIPDHQIEAEAAVIYDEFIGSKAPKLVNINHQTAQGVEEFRSKPTRSMFQEAQQSIYLLMARDSFVRFINSEAFQAALKR